MPQPDFAQIKVTRLQAWRDYLEYLIDQGYSQQEVAPLRKYNGALASSNAHEDSEPELLELHGVGTKK